METLWGFDSPSRHHTGRCFTLLTFRDPSCFKRTDSVLYRLNDKATENIDVRSCEARPIWINWKNPRAFLTTLRLAYAVAPRNNGNQTDEAFNPGARSSRHAYVDLPSLIEAHTGQVEATKPSRLGPMVGTSSKKLTPSSR